MSFNNKDVNGGRGFCKRRDKHALILSTDVSIQCVVLLYRFPRAVRKPDSRLVCEVPMFSNTVVLKRKSNLFVVRLLFLFGTPH